MKIGAKIIVQSVHDERGSLGLRDANRSEDSNQQWSKTVRLAKRAQSGRRRVSETSEAGRSGLASPAEQ